MKQITEYVNEQFLIDSMLEIDAKIVCEALQAKILLELSKQLQDVKDAEINKKKEDKWRSIYARNFRQLFGDQGICWDKISDDDIEEMSGDENNDKFVRSVLQQKKDAIILVRDKEDKFFEYCILSWGDMYYIGKGSETGYGMKQGERMGYRNGRRAQWHDMAQKDKIELTQGKKLYVITNISKKKSEYRDVRSEKEQAKDGMIYFDEYSLKQIANANVKRYKEIIAKHKAEKVNDNKLINEVNAIIQKVANLAATVAKDPVKYIDVISKLSIVSTWVYDKPYTSYQNYDRKYHTYGVEGLLPNLMKYTEALGDAKKEGGYSWSSKDSKMKDVERYQKNLENGVEKCKKLLEEIDSLI